MLSHDDSVAVFEITWPVVSSVDATGTTEKETVSVWLAYSGPGIVHVTALPLKPTVPAAGPASATLPPTYVTPVGIVSRPARSNAGLTAVVLTLFSAIE